MTTQGFVASHARDAQFERGLRSFYEYRDLGIKDATEGRVDAHVIRAAAGKAFSSQPHVHRVSFQLVYVLKATSVGSYRTAPILADSMYDRSVLGRSTGGKLVVYRK